MAKIQFKPYISNETLLFPPNLGEIIPLDSPVRLISTIVDQLDISEVIGSYCNVSDGPSAYHPRMLLKVVLYGYLNDIYSTRHLEAAMKRDIHLIWLSSYQFPDHTTINRFKARCKDSIKAIFASMVAILVEMGEVELSEDHFIDGTTIRARSSKTKIKWRKSAERYKAISAENINKAVDALLEEIGQSEREELTEEGHITYTAEEARELAEKIEKRAQEKGLKVKGKVKAVIEACDSNRAHAQTIEKCNGRCGYAPSDPDCGIMHAKEDGYDGRPTPNYNVQIATQNQYVLNYDVYDQANDKSIALDFVDTCIEENKVVPKSVTADSGYGSEENYVGLRERSIEAIVKYPYYDAQTSRRPVKKGSYDNFGFKLSPDQTTLICPAGHLMEVVAVTEEYSKRGFRSDSSTLRCSHCPTCPFRDRCCVPKNKNGTINRKLGNIREEEKAKAVLDRPENQVKLKRRSLEPEPVFAQLKYNHGYSRLRHFGRAKVRMDLGFVFMALNILKLYKNTKKAV